MSAALIALIASIGLSGWVFTKMNRRLGGANTSSVIWVVAVSFIILFLVIFTILKYFLNFS